jgi:hypothetical protein
MGSWCGIEELTRVRCPKCGSDLSDGPAMNYYYPIESNDVRATALAVRDLPLCVVEMNDRDTTGLVLTGGGMDLSWEICEGYIACGHYPPAHFADLPVYADRGKSEKDRRTIQACIRSCEILANWLNGRVIRLKEF